jgi:hypothetical protein
MATQTNVSQSVDRSKLTIVPFPAPQTITQLELTVLLALRGRLHQLEEQVEAAEQSIKTRLATGANLEPGDHRAEIKENLRRNVSWKDVVVRLADRLKMNGETYCAKVLSSTKPTRTVSLVVERRCRTRAGLSLPTCGSVGVCALSSH